MRLQATMHYLLHRYVYIRECMPIYSKNPKVTITFIRRSKSVVQLLVSFTFQTLNLSTVGKFRAIPICFMAISLVNHAHVQVQVHGQFFLD